MSEWFKEHDWKSCVRLKRTGGSNPLLCAKQKHAHHGVFFCLVGGTRIEEDSRVGAVLWEQNALPTNVYQRTGRMAKSAIDNCRAGRAAKGASPVASTKK